MGNENAMMHFGNRDLPEGTPDRPLVTFALFAYNQEKYIREAVEGAFSQTYSPLEIILSDDCSRDRTFEIMEEMAREYLGQHTVRVNRTPSNNGLSSHINTVAAMARGDFIVVAAGDDISHPARVEVLTDEWRKSSRRIMALHSGYRDIDQFSRVQKNNECYVHKCEPTLEEFARRNLFIVGSTAAYDRRVFTEFSLLDSKLVHEDRVLPFRALLLGGKLGSVKECLVDYRREVGLSAAYRSAGIGDPAVFSRRALCDNLQKLVDAQYTKSPEAAIYLSRNIQRYSAEVYAASLSSNLRALFRLVRNSGLVWGLRAYTKFLFRGRS